MDTVMVTGRMPLYQKTAGNAILQSFQLNASQAINLMYEKLIKEKSAAFLSTKTEDKANKWKMAGLFVDSLCSPQATRFDDMTHAEIKAERLRSRGLM